MSPHFTVPEHVQANLAARAAARQTSTQCAGEHGRCRRPATHRCARFGGSWCQTCWQQLPRTETPRPDPARTLDGLRAAAGLGAGAIYHGHTISDTRAVASGKRASGERRRAAHDDQHTAARARFLDVIGTFAALGQPFSANDVRHLLPDLPPSQTGALWNTAVRHYQLVEVGRTPDGYGHRIPIWQAKETAA